MQAPGSGRGQYYDAKWVKKAITRLVLVETLGGIAPPTKQFLHVFAKEAAGTNTDRTVYGAASASASSFVVHHTQQISMAAVAGDAGNINKQARKERTDWINKQKNKQAKPQGALFRRVRFSFLFS